MLKFIIMNGIGCHSVMTKVKEEITGVSHEKDTRFDFHYYQRAS